MYNFQQLSPADFEELTRDLLQKLWAVRLEAFKTGKDQGIDLRYAKVRDGATIVQCKHFVGSSVAKLVRPADKEKIMAAVHPHIQTPEDIFGTEDLNNLLGLYQEIEQQHFKLWLSSTAVLERVLHNAEKVQTDFDIERIQKMIPRYVQTSSYRRAMQTLAEQRFVIISGVPGIGKTTLANMLLFAHLEADYEPVVIQSSIAEGKALFKKDCHQVFYFDDFLGDTFLGNRLFDFVGKKEDSVILGFMELVAASKYSRLIVTTREHILSHAFQVSEHFRRRRVDLATHRCILEIGNYTLLDRGRILYNHIYFSDLPEAYRLELLKDEFYLRILKHANFNPRLVEWLSRYTNVKGLPPEGYQARVESILDNPEELWRIAFEQQISEASRSVVLALYSLGGKARLDLLEEVWRALHDYRSKKYNWKTAAEDWRRSLQDIEGGFLSFKYQRAEFVNPSVKDFLDAILTQNIEHYYDLLSAACGFEQIVTMWNLATSQKGELLRARIARSPEHLMSVMAQNLLGPRQEKFGSRGFANRRLDVGPEVKLRTLISVAENTRSPDALRAAMDYKEIVVDLWEKGSPHFRAATELLNVLDASRWAAIANAIPGAGLKSALLQALVEWPSGTDIATMAEYASGQGARWMDDDQKILVDLAERYLEDGFSEELADCSDTDELQRLSDNLDAISGSCGLDVTGCQDQISDRMVELAQPEPDDDERRVRTWEDGEDDSPYVHPEAELKRLFDGLR